MELLPQLFGLDIRALPFVALVALIFGTKFLTVYWVYRDASARGSSNPRSWSLWILLVDLVLLSYLYNRWRKLGERRYPRTYRDRVVETALVALYGALLGAPLVTPPDPLSMPMGYFTVLVVTLPLAYLLVYRDGWARLRTAV